MTLKLSSYLLPKFSRVPFTIYIILILLISTMVNGTLINFGKIYEDYLAKVALRFGCAKQSKHLERPLMIPSWPV